MSQQPYIDVPLGALIPDFGGMPNEQSPGYLVSAINVRSTPNGYRGIATFTDVASAATIGASLGSGSYGEVLSDGANTSLIFQNSSDGNVYESRASFGQAWQNVSPAAGSLFSGGNMFLYDGDAIITSTGRAPIKKTLSAALATLFTDLAGSPPIGVYGARVRDHLVLGNLPAIDTAAVQWSAIGNHEDWPTPGTADALSKESGRQLLNNELGPVKAVLGGEKLGVILQGNGATRMTYQGGNTVYAFDTIDASYGLGTLRAKPLRVGNHWYWVYYMGVFRTDGYTVECLSTGTIAEAFFENTLSHPSGQILQQDGTSFFTRRRTIFFQTDSSPGRLCYNVDTGRFTIIEKSDLRAIIEYRGSTTHYAVSTARKLQSLTAAAGSVTLQTGFIEIDPGYRVQIQGAHLLGTGTPGSLGIAYKTAEDYSSMSVAATGFTAMTAAGRGMRVLGRASAPFVAFQITGTSAESQLIHGIRIYFSRAEAQQ